MSDKNEIRYKSCANFGFFRLACISPQHRVGDIDLNVQQIANSLLELGKSKVQLAVFPELCVTSYSLGDLFHQECWTRESAMAVDSIAKACAESKVAVIIGMPLDLNGRLFNAAVAIDASGKLAGAVPKTYLPNSCEFYEARWFTRGDFADAKEVRIGDSVVPFGVDLLFEIGGSLLGIEICEDLWAVRPPSLEQALAGASILVNLSASNELLGKSEYRRDLVRQQSARCLAAYAYASAGPGESSADLVFSGHSMIAENGVVLGETARFCFETQSLIADIDLARLDFERRRNSSFAQGRADRIFRKIPLSTEKWSLAGSGFLRKINKWPFVPLDTALRSQSCREIFAIQATGLAKRLKHTNSKTLVLGLSGGLDSTLAALVACEAFDRLGLSRERIVAVTMPGFGTTSRTLENAEKLAQILGMTLRHISIKDSVLQHFKDIDHSENQHDVTYENSQARERTQILMDISNQTGGFVLGTGDLSELALGWCTFNGDHMSMYHVNAGVPKTLVKYLVGWCADEVFSGPEAAVLHDICDTPITPELLPVSKDGGLVQKTEETVGPYELHDFFLYHYVRCGASPEKILFLAELAFKDSYAEDEIAKWLDMFIKRFFQQQFKRNAMPDAPKVGSVALSPRGDWRMPSDACIPLRIV
jgi:NAD+ synthase (glutamine-hydrolysing)